MRLASSLLVLAALALPCVGGVVVADDSSPAASNAVDLQNARCPVKGEPAKADITATVDGMTVHFCCPKCAAKYRANPADYQSALRADPAVAKRMALAMAKPDDAPAPAPAAPTSLVTPSDKALAFHDAFRKLWADHVTWTRLYIVSAVGGLPDKDATLQRLLRNQEDLGNGIKPFYGDDAGAKLTALLKDHIAIAGDLVGAAAAKDAAKVDAANTKWLANADQLAAFLAKANPDAWPLEAGKRMLRDHLALTTEEVKARLAKDWDREIAAYDKVHTQALEMADMLSDGIRKQFPAKFE